MKWNTKNQLAYKQSTTEQAYKSQIVFMAIIGMCQAMENNHIGKERMHKIVQETMKNVDELSKYLLSNLCIEKGKQNFDVEYNREQLSRLAKQYDIKFDETMFDH